jgi:hypothetical protein
MSENQNSQSQVLVTALRYLKFKPGKRGLNSPFTCHAGGGGSHTLPNHVTGNGRSTRHLRGVITLRPGALLEISFLFINSSTVLDLVSQVRDVVLMNVYLDLRNSGGSGFWNEYMGKGREMGRSVYEQPGNEVDGSYHSKEGSK